MHPNNSIDYASLEDDQFYIRGVNITDIIKHYDLSTLVNLIMNDHIKDDSKQHLEITFIEITNHYFSLVTLRSNVITLSQNNLDKINGLISMIATVYQNIEMFTQYIQVLQLITDANHSISPYANAPTGLILCILLPCLIFDILTQNILLIPRSCQTTTSTLPYINYLFDMFFKITSDNHLLSYNNDIIQQFEKIILAMSGGFGVITPSVMVPRVVAGTGASIEKIMISFLTTCGLSHLGACSQSIQFWQDIHNIAVADCMNLIDSKIAKTQKIPGFGHPILYTDPRVEILKIYCTNNQAFTNLELIEQNMLNSYNLKLNIDGISGFMLQQLSLPEEVGTLLFAFARSFLVVAHVHKRLSKPPFGFKKQELREKIAQFPFNWV